ncbi:DUF2182 domain-containing protein [Aerosakkonemataceae cyanobacterium BLCC-F50]|uniref:DUF2182 domain-containing protein n=1 Tax=Floridaenema flaviceps BLCC-F50 TaxID=3153642 RepID=A0ABV4XJD2_9CYAN
MTNYNSSKIPAFQEGWGNLTLVWAIIFLAWVLLLIATIIGQTHLLHYQALNSHNWQELFLKLLIYFLSWQVMTVAMMLPTSLPLIGLFSKLSQQQEGKIPVLPIFIVAYLTVWTGFAIAFLLGDLVLNNFLNTLPWLQQHPWLFSGTTLLLAGIFQFSSLKEQCMKVCRHPLSFITHHYQRGLKAAWNLGIRHGLYCLGCCWALMLVMFAVGVGHLAWMLILTGIMVLEKTSPWSHKLIPAVGILLICGGTSVVLYTMFCPNILHQHHLN